MENAAVSRMMSSVTFAVVPACHAIHTSRETNPGCEMVTGYGVDGGFARSPKPKFPCSSAVTALSDHPGVMVASPTTCCDPVTTTCPAIDHVFGGVGVGVGLGDGVGGVGVFGLPPYAHRVSAHAAASLHDRSHEMRWLSTFSAADITTIWTGD
jgi:hypothetical protein